MTPAERGSQPADFQSSFRQSQIGTHAREHVRVREHECGYEHLHLEITHGISFLLVNAGPLLSLPLPPVFTSLSAGSRCCPRAEEVVLSLVKPYKVSLERAPFCCFLPRMLAFLRK